MYSFVIRLSMICDKKACAYCDLQNVKTARAPNAMHWVKVYILFPSLSFGSDVKKTSNRMDFSRLITVKPCQDVRKNDVNVILTCCRPPDSWKHVSDNKTSLRSVYFHWRPNWSTNQVMSACNYALSWSAFMMSILRDRFTPAVVTAKNTPGTHNNSAVCPFNETGIYCDG